MGFVKKRERKGIEKTNEIKFKTDNNNEVVISLNSSENSSPKS